MPQLVSWTDLARVLDVRPKTISHLVQKGMPVEAKNQYDVGRCLAWYVRYLHAQINARGITEQERDSGVNLRVERFRLLRAQASLEELALHEKQSALIPIDVYDRLVAGWRTFIRRTVLTLPGRLSGMLIGLDRRGIQDTIDREARDMLLILSKSRPAHQRDGRR